MDFYSAIKRNELLTHKKLKKKKKTMGDFKMILLREFNMQSLHTMWFNTWN
jgi:hypothetical protein